MGQTSRFLRQFHSDYNTTIWLLICDYFISKLLL